jgi:DNA-binding NarL/FixJ family response regulator
MKINLPALAIQTVKNYVSRIYSKLSVGSRVEAALWVKDNRQK